jgi:orotate phosphoribosyltransferase
MIQDYQNKVAQILIDIESVRFSFDKPFTLTSGLKSPVYVDCRKIISYVNERSIILNYAIEYFKENKIEFEILAGGETAGIPYAAFFSQILKKPMIYIRKKPKGFGKDQQIEGNYIKNQKAILIEDLATDGGSKIIFVKALREVNLKVSDIFVVFYYDIFNINASPLGSLNVKIHSLCTWKNIISVLTKKKLFSDEKIQNLKNFLHNPEDWRNKL